MLNYLAKPKNEAEATRIIKIATWYFSILVIIKFLHDYDKGQAHYLTYTFVLLLIFLINGSKKRQFVIFLIPYYLFQISIDIILFTNGHPNFLFMNAPFHLLKMFFLFRAYQACKLINPQPIINKTVLKLAWISYLCLFCFLYIFSTFDEYQNHRITWLNFADLPITCIGILGLFGYIFKKQILNASFWKYFLVIVLLWDITMFIIHPRPPLDFEISITGHAIIIILLSCVMVPYYVAVYLYGYKGSLIWKKNT